MRPVAMSHLFIPFDFKLICILHVVPLSSALYSKHLKEILVKKKIKENLSFVLFSDSFRIWKWEYMRRAAGIQVGKLWEQNNHKIVRSTISGNGIGNKYWKTNKRKWSNAMDVGCMMCTFKTLILHFPLTFYLKIKEEEEDKNEWKQWKIDGTVKLLHYYRCDCECLLFLFLYIFKVEWEC